MKKIIIVALTLFAATTLSAQNLGVKIGANLEVNYKYALSETAFAEGSIGLNQWGRGVQLAATYNKPITTLDLSGIKLNIYAGGGLGMIYRWNDNRTISAFGEMNGYTDSDNVYHKHTTAIVFGVVGNVGAEYALPNLPMTIALEYRPMLGLAMGTYAGNSYNDDLTSWEKSRFFTPGLFDLGVIVRYKF